MIHVVAVITAKPGMREAILKEFRANVPAVHAENGCIEYGPAVDAEGSPAKYGDDTFLVIEKWESPEALKAHAASPHMAAYGAKTSRDGGQPRHPHPVAGIARDRLRRNCRTARSARCISSSVQSQAARISSLPATSICWLNL